MRKRFSTTDIDRFFTHLKEQPPIYNEEKVHQIINSPKAVARLKGKNKNLLKFTIMTTIFAVIVSAVLMWQGEKSQNTKDQIPNSVTQTVELVSDVDENKASNKKSNIASILSVKETDNTISNTVEPIKQTNEPTGIIKSQQEEVLVDTNREPIQPIDGSRFILKLSNEELAKIGIRIVDKSIVYKNIANGYCYEFGTRFYKAYIQNTPENYSFLKDEKGQKYSEHYVGIGFSRKNWIEDEKTVRKKNVKPEVINGSTEQYSYYYEIPEDTILPTQLDFYPVFESNEYYGDIFGNGTLNSSDFEMANDTLVPIVFPKTGGGRDTEVILWFVLTKQLYDILSVNHKPLMDELIQYKTVKKRFPHKNIIEYRSPFLIDESKILKLSQNELQKMGFSFYADSTVYIGNNSKGHYKVMLSEKQSSMNAMKFDGLQVPELNDGCLALFVTDNSGNPLHNSLGLLSMLFPNQDEIYKQIPRLIPVEVKGGGFYNSLFFWFIPNESFFKAISKDVSTEIKAEYDYVVAEDKSNLEKPECKYFDECKNTLKVSNFKVYPNPAKNQATVSFTLPEAIDGRITLVDLAGRERQMLKPQTSFSKGSHRIDVDVSSVPEGIYLLTLYSDKGVQTQRLIVAR